MHHVPDWPFGARGRRLLLGALLLDDQPTDGWSRRDLEARVGVSNGGLDGLLAGAVDLGLAELSDARILVPSDPPELAEALAAVLRLVDPLPDRPIRGLPRRPYGRA